MRSAKIELVGGRSTAMLKCKNWTPSRILPVGTVKRRRLYGWAASPVFRLFPVSKVSRVSKIASAPSRSTRRATKPPFKGGVN